MLVDSWIQLSSPPSSSSLSSAGEDIITTGLRLSQSQEQRRRRRLRRSVPDRDRTMIPHQQRGAFSSQEQYEESESESDRVMNSSNEGITLSTEEWRVSRPISSASSDNAYASNEDGDMDEDATAVGSAPPDDCFTPQPNAFTYTPASPPSTLSSSSRPTTAIPAQDLQMPQASSYFSQQRPVIRTPHHRHSFPASQPPQHSPYHIISPSHNIDHDAALRASLNTLLSCAAAARRLPKSDLTARCAPRSNRIDTSTLCMVPESVAKGTGKSSAANATARPAPALSPAIITSDGATEPGKRKMTGPSGTTATNQPITTTTPRSSSKHGQQRATKKPRRTSSTPASPPALMDDLTPTLLTWALSASVVVLVSALSFSAGYVVGKDVGRAEAEAAQGFVEAIGNGGLSCGGDLTREGGMGAGTGLGLRRWRWTGGGGVVQV